MKSTRLRIWLGVLGGAALLLCVVCGIGVWLAFRGSQQALTTSDQTAQQLLQALQHHRWQVALQHFTPQAQTRFTPAVLQQRWHLVEQATGTVQRWVRTNFSDLCGDGRAADGFAVSAGGCSRCGGGTDAVVLGGRAVVSGGAGV